MPNEIRQNKYDIKQSAPLNYKTPPPKSLEAYGLLYLIYISLPTPVIPNRGAAAHKGAVSRC